MTSRLPEIVRRYIQKTGYMERPMDVSPPPSASGRTTRQISLRVSLRAALRAALPCAPLLSLLAACLLPGAVLSWPSILHPLDRVPSTPFTEGHLIALGVGGDQLPGILLTDRLGWPQQSHFRPLLWPAVVLSAITGPAVAFNAMYWLIPLLNALGGLLLARALRLPPWGQAALGGLLAWNTWVFTTLANGQIEQSLTGGVAAIWGACLLGADRWRWLPLAPLLMLGLALAAPHVALISALGLIVIGGMDAPAAVLSAIRAARSRPQPPAPSALPALPAPPARRAAARLARWLLLGISTAAAAAAALSYHAPAAMGRMTVFAPRGGAVAGYVAPWQFDSASLTDLLLPPLRPDAAPATVHTAFLGWITLAAALLGAGWLLARMLRPDPAPADPAPADPAPALTASLSMLPVAALLALCAAGLQLDIAGRTIPTPLGLIAAHSSELARSSSPYRMAMGAVVALSALAALPARRWWIALPLVALAWGEVSAVRNRGIPLPSAALSPPAWDLSAGTGPVLDLPPVGTCGNAPYHYAMAALSHRRPILHTLRLGKEAYGKNERVVPWLWKTMSGEGCADKIKGQLRGIGVTAVVLHRDVQCAIPAGVAECLQAGLGAGRTGGGHTVWELE